MAVDFDATKGSTLPNSRKISRRRECGLMPGQGKTRTLEGTLGTRYLKEPCRK